MQLHLIVQYYHESRDDRRSELEYCLRRNLEDARIACVHDLQSTVVPARDIAEHPKYRASSESQWLTYDRAFRYANQHLAGELVAVANLDIFLSAEFDVDALAGISKDMILALSRWEYNPKTDQMWLDPAFAKWDMAVSQDLWLFKPAIHVQNCDFKLGTIGCDHAIAHRFHTSGYLPVNDCLRFRICHVDQCRGKTGANGLQFHERRPEIQTFPGQEGRMLLPMLKGEVNLDAAATQLGLNRIAKYRTLVDMWNSNLKLRSFSEVSDK